MLKIKKNKLGFTLIELLAVITIIVIILAFALPVLIKQLNHSKNDSLETTKEVIISAARSYVVDNEKEIPTTISVSELCSSEYLECPIVNPADNSELSGYVVVDTNKNYTYVSDTEFVKLIVNLNGGSTTQTFSRAYAKGSTLQLINPTYSGYMFINWTVSGTGASINGSTLTMGSKDTIISANWNTFSYYIAFNANGGTGTMNNQTLSSGESGTLTSNAFTRYGYEFQGWSANSGATSITYTNNDTVSDLTTVNNDVVNLYAIWKPYVCSTGTISTNASNEYICVIAATGTTGNCNCQTCSRVVERWAGSDNFLGYYTEYYTCCDTCTTYSCNDGWSIINSNQCYVTAVLQP